MKFYDYDKKRPKEGQFCLIREKLPYGMNLLLWPQPYYNYCGFQNHPTVVSWAPVPEHICNNPKGWKSHYRGDDLPKKSGWYIVCTDKSKIVSHAYFDVKVQRFLGNPDVVAYMPI